MKRTFEGICPCGGRLKTAEWITLDHYRGRSTCTSCGRTELKESERTEEDKRKQPPLPI